MPVRVVGLGDSGGGTSGCGGDVAGGRDKWLRGRGPGLPLSSQSSHFVLPKKMGGRLGGQNGRIGRTKMEDV